MMPRWLVLLLATAVGVIVANIYYAQPLVALISQSIGIAPEAAGLVVTLTQVGYGLGVLFLVPLGDMVESRKLVVSMIGVTLLGLIGLAFADHPIPYFVAAFFTGVGASCVQVLVPYAAHFAPPEKRGQVVGSLMSGLMLGIMLSRPISSFISDLISWHAVFVLSSVLMIVIGFALMKLLPPKPAKVGVKYGELLRSMFSLFARLTVLRRRGVYQALLFGSFCLFWTAAPLLLSSEIFGFSQSQIAVFALVGVSGAIAAPFAGRAADRNWVRPATFVSITVSALSFLLTLAFDLGSTASFVTLVIGAIVLDAGITANLVLSQRTIFALGDDFRSRLNALFVAMIFIGGAIGSTLGAWAYASGGWKMTVLAGCAMPATALIVFLTERKNLYSEPA